MTIQTGIGLSTKKEPLRAAQEALEQARFNLNSEKINLAMVFSDVSFAHPSILQFIRKTLKGTPIVGCSSLAIISNQGIFKQALAIALITLPEDTYINTAYVENINSKSIASAGKELGEGLLYGFRSIRRALSIIFSDGLIANGSAFLNGLEEELGKSFPLAGGSASDNLALKKTYQYADELVLSNGACGVLWGGKLNFGLGTKHGWKPLGKPRTVTNSSSNIVYEIEGMPAVKIYEQYFSADTPRLRQELKYISTLYPIGIYLDGEQEYLLRNLLSIKDNGSLTFQGDVPEGSQIRLMIGTKESCLNAARQAAEEVRAGLLGRNPKFVFVFDSISRYILLGREVKRELKIINETLGEDTPIIGIYTYGEQAPLKALNYLGRTHFHNQSITILGIGG